MNISDIEPKAVFRYFEEISSIPRSSHDEKQISDYCVKFAKDRKLEHYQDELGNVIIIREASAGLEDKPPIIIQGHLDMVCEKEDDCTTDFKKDGLKLNTDGKYIYAEGTTLGADDGIAIAYALALLDDTEFRTPRLECVFTVGEETGMYGATAIDLSPVKGHHLLNIDSEDEGILTAGCAGGASCELTFNLKKSSLTGTRFDIAASNLTGGHSGVDIIKNRANANKLMGAILLALSERTDFGIISTSGGLKDNAIPRLCRASIIVPENKETLAEETIKLAFEAFLKIYSVTEKDAELSIKKETGVSAEGAADTEKDRIVFLLSQTQNGIQRMSDYVDNLVESSLNMGIMKYDGNVLKMVFSVRSSVQEARDYIVAGLKSHANILGGEFRVTSTYPGWEYRADSALRELMIGIFEEQFGKTPVVDVIHAGIECGIFAEKIKDFDAVSFGPDILDIHTTRERLDIASAERTWRFLREIVARW